MVEKTKKKIRCPYCSEKIVFDAKKCRYCGEWLNKKTFKEKIFHLLPKKILSKKGFVFVVVTIFLITFFKNILTSPNNVEIKTTDTLNSSEEVLKNTAIKQYQLFSSGKKEDWIELYREFYTPDNVVKEKSEDEFVSNNLDHRFQMEEKGLNHVEFEIHSVRVNGVIGYVDRTEKPCGNYDCTVFFATPQRMVKKYIYAENKWLMTDEEVTCTRSQPYPMEPEFERVLSLILQRVENTEDGDIIKNIKNCLSIEYAASENEMDGAEGSFLFYKGQSLDKLDILVSPKYKFKDDLVTSILLIHEITHASIYSLTFQGYDVNCFEDEATAYAMQRSFINNSLNDEEKKSLNARLQTDSTPEIANLKYVFNGIDESPGSDYIEKSINFIKTIPAYQEQCSDNSKN